MLLSPAVIFLLTRGVTLKVPQDGEKEEETISQKKSVYLITFAILLLG